MATDPAELEAELERLVKAEHICGAANQVPPSDCTACYAEALLWKSGIAAVALALARALRTLGDTCGLDDAEFREGLEADGTIYPAVPFAELKDALDALADFDRLLAVLLGQR